MKKKYFALIIILFISLPALLSQGYENDPLEDGHIISQGGVSEVVYSAHNSVSIYKFYKEHEFAPWDTIIQILKYEHGGGYGNSPGMITADLDGDLLSEIVNVWIENDAVEPADFKSGNIPV